MKKLIPILLLFFASCSQNNKVDNDRLQRMKQKIKLEEVRQRISEDSATLNHNEGLLKIDSDENYIPDTLRPSYKIAKYKSELDSLIKISDSLNKILNPKS